MKNHIFKVLLTLTLIAMPVAGTCEPIEKLKFVGRYDFDFNSIYLGYVTLSIHETDDDYTMRLLVKSGGIVNLFTRHMSDTSASGKILQGNYVPLQYESHYKTKNKPRHVKLSYNVKGVVTEELNEPLEDRNDRPEVPHTLKDNTYDPLTGIMALRSGEQKLRIFDAKRLYDAKADLGAKRHLELMRTSHMAYSFVLSRTPVAGLTGKELKEYKGGEPPVIFYFSEDARRIPLALFMPIYFGRLEGVLTKECNTWEECADK